MPMHTRQIRVLSCVVPPLYGHLDCLVLVVIH